MRRPGQRAIKLRRNEKATHRTYGTDMRNKHSGPAPVKPHTGKSNANELSFDLLDSGYSVGTAKTKETGRSQTLQFFHGSEVAYWPNANGHFSGVMQAIPDMPGSEVILESTSAGATGECYALWQQAVAGELDYATIFVPWF